MTELTKMDKAQQILGDAESLIVDTAKRTDVIKDKEFREFLSSHKQIKNIIENEFKHYVEKENKSFHEFVDPVLERAKDEIKILRGNAELFSVVETEPLSKEIISIDNEIKELRTKKELALLNIKQRCSESTKKYIEDNGDAAIEKACEYFYLVESFCRNHPKTIRVAAFRISQEVVEKYENNKTLFYLDKHEKIRCAINPDKEDKNRP
jgi:ElaB/YqjD/DUF883 family membrane-anchored ribosome-binding protein